MDSWAGYEEQDTACTNPIPASSASRWRDMGLTRVRTHTTHMHTHTCMSTCTHTGHLSSPGANSTRLGKSGSGCWQRATQCGHRRARRDSCVAAASCAISLVSRSHPASSAPPQPGTGHPAPNTAQLPPDVPVAANQPHGGDGSLGVGAGSAVRGRGGSVRVEEEKPQVRVAWLLGGPRARGPGPPGASGGGGLPSPEA